MEIFDSLKFDKFVVYIIIAVLQLLIGVTTWLTKKRTDDRDKLIQKKVDDFFIHIGKEMEAQWKRIDEIKNIEINLARLEGKLNGNYKR